MLALRFRFPAGHYHATPWGRNVNEADVAWPPEPWRLLRALIATYWSKGDQQRWREADLGRLIDALAERPPAYALPEGAVHAHTRHYMPQKLGATKLVFDAFFGLPKRTEIVVVWRNVTLDAELFDLVSDLASGIGYLGRAESWTECEALNDWNGKPNCGPRRDGFHGRTVRILSPLCPSDYAKERARLIGEERQRVASRAKSPPTEKTLDRQVAKAFLSKRGLDTLPERLYDALSLDTADWQGIGWPRPPAASEILYALASNAGAGAAPFVSARQSGVSLQHSWPTVARFILAGRPRPRVEDTVKIGELMRLAALSKFGWEDDASSARPKAPTEISGRTKDGRPLRNPFHSHAFWLPEDADSDGRIDHISVFVAGGMSPDVRDKLDRITKIWLKPKAPEEDGPGVASADEWRLALEGFGWPHEFSDSARIFGSSMRWQSATPFLAAGHLKRPGCAGYARELRRLLSKTGVGERFGFETGEVRISELDEIRVGETPRRTLHFHRFRSRGRERQLDAGGTFLEMVFPIPVDGPIALGYGSHFGLGLFVRQAE